jgi:hypothetical protein
MLNFWSFRGIATGAASRPTMGARMSRPINPWSVYALMGTLTAMGAVFVGLAGWATWAAVSWLLG